MLVGYEKKIPLDACFLCIITYVLARVGLLDYPKQLYLKISSYYSFDYIDNDSKNCNQNNDYPHTSTHDYNVITLLF